MPSLHCQPWQRPLKTTTHAQINTKPRHNTTKQSSHKQAVLHKATALDKAMAMRTANISKHSAPAHPPTINAPTKYSHTAIGEKAKS